MCGPSSAPNSSCRRCGRTASSQARKTTCVTKEMSLLLIQFMCFAHSIQNTTHESYFFYLMQREHSKSLGSSRSLGKLLQVFSLEGFFLELFANPEIITHTKKSLIVQSQDCSSNQDKSKQKLFRPCFLYLLLPLSTRQGSVSDTGSFLFSRLALS